MDLVQVPRFLSRGNSGFPSVRTGSRTHSCLSVNCAFKEQAFTPVIKDAQTAILAEVGIHFALTKTPNEQNLPPAAITF